MVIAAVYLLGALHGCILAFVLAQKKVNRLPNKFLASLMAVFSLDLGMAAFQSFGLHEPYPHLIALDYPVTLLYGPFLYLYVKTLRDGNPRISSSDYLHFIPFALLLVYLIPFYMGPASDKLAMLNNTESILSLYHFAVITHIKVLHGMAYVVGVVYVFISYRKKLKDSFSSIEKINLAWLQHLIAGITILAGVAGALHIFSSVEDTVLMGLNENVYGNLTLLATTVFVFGIGYMGLHQPEVFVHSVHTGLSANNPASAESQGSRSEENSKKPYQKSGLDRDQAEQYISRLLRIMEEKKLYRNSELKLADLADELKISSHNLTEIINHYLGQSFYDFVNSYRVEEVKRQLQDPESEDATLLAIGLDAGFNSKSTFNAVFKKQTGMTPSQYRKQEGLLRNSPLNPPPVGGQAL